VKPCTLLSLYCPGITSEESRDEENEVETSSRSLSRLAKVANGQVRDFETCPLPHGRHGDHSSPVEGISPHIVDEYIKT